MIDSAVDTDLFSPMTMGAIQLANRIVMAPVTRSRMADDGVPNECTLLITPSVPARA